MKLKNAVINKQLFWKDLTMENMLIAAQCIDGRTGQIGSFGFRTKCNTIKGPLFYSSTPVFQDLVKLFEYMHKNNIPIDHTPKNYADVPERT